MDMFKYEVLNFWKNVSKNLYAIGCFGEMSYFYKNNYKSNVKKKKKTNIQNTIFIEYSRVLLWILLKKCFTLIWL